MTVSGSSSCSSSATSADTLSKMADLQKQVQTIAKRIADENKSSDDAKTKQQMIQLLVEQMQAVQLQIQQLQQQKQQAQQSAQKQTAVAKPAITPTSSVNLDAGHRLQASA